MAAAAVALAIGLSGCAGNAGYSTATARGLQRSVFDVASSAAGSDYSAALTRLSALERLNDADAEKGTIEPARHDAIARSIALVRADLIQLQDAATTAELRARLQQLQEQQEQQKTQAPTPPKKKGGPKPPGPKG
ncbi:hypothetical protein GCM10009840_10400 [Pseudolysinimonas kribbensis]|uniref:Lipoprotein n=1 Tax=Pseudolysinimonas kribbensis TaxID=433641 RepID=A0ABQ6K6U3_9MICO|nr:hypothetical protein GCM10025881_22850 [Pseudolysinimonas kribbensis]